MLKQALCATAYTPTNTPAAGLRIKLHETNCFHYILVMHSSVPHVPAPTPGGAQGAPGPGRQRHHCCGGRHERTALCGAAGPRRVREAPAQRRWAHMEVVFAW